MRNCAEERQAEGGSRHDDTAPIARYSIFHTANCGLTVTPEPAEMTTSSPPSLMWCSALTATPSATFALRSSAGARALHRPHTLTMPFSYPVTRCIAVSSSASSSSSSFPLTSDACDRGDATSTPAPSPTLCANANADTLDLSEPPPAPASPAPPPPPPVLPFLSELYEATQAPDTTSTISMVLSGQTTAALVVPLPTN